MQSYFLVCVRFSLVATDIVATLEEMGLGTPLVAGGEEEALRHLTALPPGAALRVAVVEAPPAQFSTSPLRVRLDAMDARTILMSGAPTEVAEPHSFPVLPTPFFTEDLIALITGARPA